MHFWACAKCGECAIGAEAAIIAIIKEHMCDADTKKSDNFVKGITMLKGLSSEPLPPPCPPPQKSQCRLVPAGSYSKQTNFFGFKNSVKFYT